MPSDTGNTGNAAITERGTLFLVVGPSGVGKDSVIDGVRTRLAGDPRYVFLRRYITRPEDSGGEDHLPIDVDAFEAARSAGAFSLSWEAHGLRYALPASLDDILASGRHAIANVSRSVIGEARHRYPPVRVLNITAKPETVRKRLEARGREDAAEIEERVRRVVAFDPGSSDVVSISNDGPLDRGIDATISALLMPTL